MGVLKSETHCIHTTLNQGNTGKHIVLPHGGNQLAIIQYIPSHLFLSLRAVYISFFVGLVLPVVMSVNTRR